jgi:two-component system phosphate regulon response regulator PhoB
MTSLSVILAEDDPDIQLVARLALKRAGFTVRVANNGVEAVAMVREQPPDAILLDWMMPEMDGLQACAILKGDPATSHIPIIFLTAKTQDSEIQRGMSLGASGYVTKPFDALTLGDQVRAIIAAQAP